MLIVVIKLVIVSQIVHLYMTFFSELCSGLHFIFLVE